MSLRTSFVPPVGYDPETKNIRWSTNEYPPKGKLAAIFWWFFRWVYYSPVVLWMTGNPARPENEKK